MAKFMSNPGKQKPSEKAVRANPKKQVRANQSEDETSEAEEETKPEVTKTRRRTVEEGVSGTSITIRKGTASVHNDKEPAAKTAEQSALTPRDKEITQSESRKRLSEIPLYVIVGLRVDILTAHVLKAISVGRVTNSSDDGNCAGGINDIRAGTLDDTKVCRSCKEINLSCAGHLQYIQLPDKVKFVPNIFLETVVRILRCICAHCNGLLVTEVFMSQTLLLNYQKEDRLKHLADVCVRFKFKCQRYQGNMPGSFTPLKCDPTKTKTKNCLQNPIYRIHANTIQCVDQNTKQKSKNTHRASNEQEEKVSTLPMEIVEEMLACISPADKVLMGFPADKNLAGYVTNRIPVIPLNARPHIYQNGEIKVDQFSDKLNDIVSKVRSYKSASGEAEQASIIRNIVYDNYSHLVDNSDGSLERNRDPVISVKDRITGKKGAIRGHGMGKRVDFSERTLAGPASELRFGEIGVPEVTRSELTVPESVTRHNIDKLQKMYDEGKIKTIKFGPDTRSEKLRGSTVIASRVKARIPKLAIGDIVERYGEEGDVCLVGRQPTLHKESLQGYRGRYVKTRQIKMHLCNTGAHNADFDGDEFTEHKGQTVGARAEMRLIANTESCLGDSQKSKTMAGLTYNHLSSVTIMTGMGEDEVTLDDEEMEEAVSILTWRQDFATMPSRLAEQGVPPNSGRALFSYILPAGFCYRGGKTSRTVRSVAEDGKVVESELDTTVVIEDGILKTGIITKKHVGAVHNSIVHYLWVTFGKERTSAFLTDGAYLSDWFIFNYGFSIGIADCEAPNPAEVERVIAEEMHKAELAIDSLGPETEGMTAAEKEYREQQIRGFTNNAAAIGKKVGQEQLASNNALNIMDNSGAKGNPSNTAGITSLVGQQFIRRERPVPTLSGGTRCLPYFVPNSRKLEARGMCRESFMKGLKPAGAFYHMGASRVGLVGTAVLTSKTGSLHHRIVKVFESVLVAYDGSVRNTLGVCFQPVCSDGFEAGKMIPVEVNGLGQVFTFIDIKNTVRNLNFNIRKRLQQLEKAGVKVVATN